MIMLKSINIFLFSVCLVFTVFSYTSAISKEKNYGNFYNVKVVRNYDGDTLTVNIPDVPALFGNNINVRVLGIDTPEIRGGCEKERALALEAKEFVSDIFKDNAYVTISNTKRGKYFRILADVQTAQGDLAAILLDKGLAVKYDGRTKIKNWCE